MISENKKPILSIFLSATLVLVAGQAAFGGTLLTTQAAAIQALDAAIEKMDLKSTDSAGSFSYDAPKAGVSKTETPKPPAVSPAPPKAEGSKGKKGKPHPGKAFSHKRSEGGKGKGYARHGKRHYKMGDHKKGAHGYKYQREGSHGKRYAGRHPGGPGSKYGHGKKRGHASCPFTHVLRFSHKLGLSADQIKRIQDARFEFRKFRIKNRAALDIAKMELEREVHSGKVNEAKIRSHAEAIAKTKAEKIRQMGEAKITLLKIMTPEQRAKMSAMASAH